jgi:hypothetical protein
MEYIDPHHKRTNFTATSFSEDTDSACRRLAFAGQGQHGEVILIERGSAIAAVVPETSIEFTIGKVQILDRLKWLTLDFEENTVLRRIVIHIDQLDADQLSASLKRMIGARPVIFNRYDV